MTITSLPLQQEKGKKLNAKIKNTAVQNHHCGLKTLQFETHSIF